MASTQHTQHTLIVNSGPNIGQSYVLQDVMSTLGRSADNTIVLDSSQVSRYHAKITILPHGVMIEDAGSTNGTFVNGQRITAQSQLSSGDSIGIADYITFKFVVEDVMGMGADYPPMTGGSTAVMESPLGLNQSQAPPTAPQIGTHIPEFQPNAFVPAPSGLPPAPAITPDIPKKNTTSLYIIIAILVVMICFCVAIAIFLWFAPEAFWRDFFNFFGIPWPSKPMLIFLW